MRNLFRKQTELDEYGYCVHLSTGYDLGDMCEMCSDARIAQWSFKVTREWRWFTMRLYNIRHNKSISKYWVDKK